MRRLAEEPPDLVLPEIYALKEHGSLASLKLLRGSRVVASFGDDICRPRSHYEVPLFINGTVAVLVVDVR